MRNVLDKRLVLATTLVVALWAAPSGRADTLVNPSTEYLNRIKVSESVQPMGDSPFGENISLYSGALSFRQTDISFPGIGPTISLTRSYEASGSPITYANDLPMADWDLSIPRISTIVAGNRMGYQGIWSVQPLIVTQTGSISVARCTNIGEIDHSPFGYGLAWWHGYQLITGDGASQALLKRTATNTLAPGNQTALYPIVTPGHWMVSCLAGTSNGLAGEAFMATSPDGTKYWFDHLAYGAALETLVESIPHWNNPDAPLATAPADAGDGTTGATSTTPTDPTPNVYWGEDQQFLPRKMGHMYASRVEDRFGNWLTYSYDANDHLVEINASDLRKVQITWRTDAPLIDRITLQPGSAGARTWRYEYANPTIREIRALLRVVQPDETRWDFEMGGANQVQVPPANQDNECGIRTFTQIPSDDNWSWITIGHPSGLVGQFNMSVRAHSRSWVPTMCAQLDGTLMPWVERLPPVYLALSVTSKSISGAGVAPATWNYKYSPARGSSKDECTAAPCRDWKWVEVTDPSNQTTHYNFSTRWGHSEGRLQSTVTAVTVAGQDFPTGLRVQDLSYADPLQAWPFPTRIGEAIDDARSFSNTATTETRSPEVLSRLTVQEVVFSTQTTSFDRFGQPETVVRSNSTGSSRTDSTTYWPVDGQWVLGQVWKSLLAGKLAGQTEYDARIQPVRTYSFGVLTATYAYHPTGLVASITDPLGNLTRLDNYKRGVPQRVEFADASVVVPTVDDFGQIRVLTNQLGDSTSYGYDAMGRMVRLDYPAGDSIAWNPVLRNFTMGLVAAYGLPVGHWKQTVETGAASTSTYYDALWRPRLILTEDKANGASKSFVVKRYDESSREVFSSYPVDLLASVDDALLGVRTEYDALGRVSAMRQDSEQGVLVTTSSYLPQFRVRITNPRQYQTTTSFQIFDVPSEQAPIRIEAPEGVTTIIERDPFGKPQRISRQGPAG